MGVMDKNIEKWSSLKEVTDYLGASRESVFKWIEHKGMPAHKLGKLWKFKISEVDGWIRSGMAGKRDEAAVGHNEDSDSENR
jgi:excisionase family DNA binding protein